MDRAATLDVDDALLRRWPLPALAADGDKESRGRTLVVAGSREMPGAAWLAAIAALRAGAGKLCVATAASVAPGLALQLPEARVIGLRERSAGGLAEDSVAMIKDELARADAVLIGPGLQDEAASGAFVRAILERLAGNRRARLVLDAMAMCAPTAPFLRPALMTPHAGEMAHLTGLPKDTVAEHAEAVAREAAERWNVIVALKGAVTVIASPTGQTWRHAGGGVGLATSGSGDTLAGIVAGLAARGASLEQAAVWGVALHARAGDALAERLGPLGYLASELPREIPALLRGLSPVLSRD